MFRATEDKKSITEIVNNSNVIAKETKIVGDILAQGNIRIEGVIEGKVESKSKIVIGESALITGDLISVEAEISGKIFGAVKCSEMLYLKSTAVIEGDIFTSKLVIENGAKFNGKCHMMGASITLNKSNQKNE